MPNFSYKGRNRRGEAMIGQMEAENAERVAEQLFHSGITPVDINEAKGSGSRDLDFGFINEWFKPGVSLDELVMLCRQLRTLMKAGVPILRGLTGLAETTRNPTLGHAVRDVHDQFQGGREFYASLAQHPRIFTPLFVSLVRVGESSGRLDDAFAQLADYLELEKVTGERIKSALRYPMVVMGAIVLAITVINVMVVPAFAEIFAKYNTELPLMTRILIGTSNFTVNYWPVILGGIVVGVFGFHYWVKTEQGNYTWSKTLLRMPLIGHILNRATLGRFARTFAMTIKSGVPIIQGLTVVADVVDNAYVSERIQSMREGIEKGDSISRTASVSGLFTPLVLQMIAVGEETGAIDQLLDETADHYSSEVEYELKRLSDAIEPIVIMIIGAMVLVLALGVFLPMWDLGTVATR